MKNAENDTERTSAYGKKESGFSTIGISRDTVNRSELRASSERKAPSCT